MKIPLYRESSKTGSKVLVPKKELCTAIKAKFNSKYHRDEKYNWKDIQDGLRRPRNKVKNNTGQSYSPLDIDMQPFTKKKVSKKQVLKAALQKKKIVKRKAQ